MKAINAALSDEDYITYSADAVICTLPLGVLKQSMAVPTTSSCSSSAIRNNAPQFIPPLPLWKQVAINRMGCGVVNKVILCYDECFWQPVTSSFGSCVNETEMRGDLFQFWTFGDYCSSASGEKVSSEPKKSFFWTFTIFINCLLM